MVHTTVHELVDEVALTPAFDTPPTAEAAEEAEELLFLLLLLLLLAVVSFFSDDITDNAVAESNPD